VLCSGAEWLLTFAALDRTGGSEARFECDAKADKFG
jgi:hypothetical protein